MPPRYGSRLEKFTSKNIEGGGGLEWEPSGGLKAANWARSTYATQLSPSGSATGPQLVMTSGHSAHLPSNILILLWFFGRRRGARTPDPLIKSLKLGVRQ